MAPSSSHLTEGRGPPRAHLGLTRALLQRLCRAIQRTAGCWVARHLRPHQRKITCPPPPFHLDRGEGATSTELLPGLPEPTHCLCRGHSENSWTLDGPGILSHTHKASTKHHGPSSPTSLERRGHHSSSFRAHCSTSASPLPGLLPHPHKGGGPGIYKISPRKELALFTPIHF